MAESSGRVAVVTGGAKGIGEAIARTLAAGGDTCVLADIDLEAAHAAAAGIDRAEAEYLDLASLDSINDMFGRVISKFGRVDVLVNCAAMPSRVPFEQMTAEHWDSVMAVDLDSVMHTSRIAAGDMKRRGRGWIVNIASLRANLCDVTHPAYAVAKAAVVSLTSNLAVAYAKYGINVNCVSPGYVLTPMTAHHMEKDPAWRDEMLAKIPSGRFLSAEDIANTVCYLASENARGIVGQTIVVDGGRLINDL